ncbi:Splicing factor 3B subunit 3 [Terramyces sp. JEL0728]|nr:Splicing factor 3B subunit 3 [Terramyces sp. JEL0728]
MSGNKVDEKKSVTLPKWKSLGQILIHALKGSSRAFLFSFLIRGGITFLLSLNKLYRKKIGSFSLIWKLVSNTLAFVEGRHTKRQGAIAGFLAGFAILCETRPNRIGYTQQFFMRSMQAGKNALKQRNIPTVPHGDTLLFCLACAQLLYASAFRPSTLPKEYYAFIIRTAKVPKEFLLAQSLHLRNLANPEYSADDSMLKTMQLLKATSTNITKLQDRIVEYRGRMPSLPCCIYHPNVDSCAECASLKWLAIYKQMTPVYFTLNIVPLLVLKTKHFVLKSIQPFRLTGSSKDFIVIGSDSGRIVVLEYADGRFNKLHQETFGKSGCRRAVPGQYLASDPKGRAIMIGAMEKQKFVYVLNRDANSKLTISSPLEAHKSHTVCAHIVPIDVGFENPIFASIEVDFGESDTDHTGKAFENIEQKLIFHELDLGLNHVGRKWNAVIDRTSNYLVPVPGGNDGPSGVLVCSEGYISWFHPDYQPVRIPIPKRKNPLDPVPYPNGELPPERKTIIISSAVHRLKKSFFILLQTELGDVFKLTMDYITGADGGFGQVANIRLKYFESLPPSTGLNLLKSGFLFVASEFGNHQVYQVENLGDDDEEQPEFQSIEIDENSPQPEITPRKLRNLALVDEVNSLSPLIDATVANLTGDDSPQIYALCGKGARSSFRILRHGLEVSELATADLPGSPTALWTVRGSVEDEYDSFIIISFINATLVLSIGESIEEVQDTGILDTTPTISAGQLGDDALVQIYPKGIRHIRSDRRVSEWKAPAGKTIIQGSSNYKQVAIALSDGEIVYFELDNAGNLNEFQDRKEMNANVTCMAMSPIPEGRQRARFLAIGCDDNTVRVLSLDPNSCLESVSMQALSAQAESLVMVEMVDPTTSVTLLYLNMGLANGVFLRTTVDNVTGLLTDSRLKFLGAKPVKLFPVQIAGGPGVLALSTRPWLSFTYQSRSKLTPLSYESLEFGSKFCSEPCPEGIAAVVGNTLRILNVDKLQNVFNQVSIPLDYTPKRFMLHEESSNFVVLEAENCTPCQSEKVRILTTRAQMEMDTDDGSMLEELDASHFGLPKAAPGNWASCIRILSPFSGDTLWKHELDDNEAAVSIAQCLFAAHAHEKLLIVGTMKNMVLNPKSNSGGCLWVFKFKEDGSKLELYHKTDIEDAPLALLPFQGRLLVGVGSVLRIYELGKKKLLRKCESKAFPHNIIKLHTQGDRIMASDASESIQFAQYRHFDNRIVIFADDPTPRWMTCSALLDYDTVAGGDKFGNIFIGRLDAEISKAIVEDTTGNTAMYDRGFLQGAPHKLSSVVSYFVGESISSITKVALVPGGRELLLYTTLLGTVGIMIVFTAKEDIEFFQLLEMALRQEVPPLAGRNHLLYRGFFAPVQNVVDGDLCEMFNTLPNEKKRSLAESLDRTVSEVAKKLDDIRSRVAF